MTRRDVQGYAQDLIAQSEKQQQPAPPKIPAKPRLEVVRGGGGKR